MIRALLSPLYPLWRELEIRYLRWALREMPATHPDVPKVVLRLRALLDEPQPEPIKAIARWM
jgi:hypothetical protein